MKFRACYLIKLDPTLFYALTLLKKKNLLSSKFTHHIMQKEWRGWQCFSKIIKHYYKEKVEKQDLFTTFMITEELFFIFKGLFSEILTYMLNPSYDVSRIHSMSD